MLSVVLGSVGTLLGVFRAWPQFRQIVMEKQTDGVSVPTWALTLLNNTAWLTLGVMIGSFAVSISNIISALGCIAVLVAVARQRAFHFTPKFAGVAVAGAAVVTTAGVIGPSALTILANGLAISMFLPQLVTVLKGCAAGVSTVTWTMTTLSSVAWAGYAFAISEPSLAVCHAIIFPTAFLITVKTIRDNRNYSDVSEERDLAAA